ncbi:MAG: pilus assembly protein [Gammaproteobacteria bacterium]|nr:pilus assembly protein [Gammaproteobacteria bacterium]
MFVVNYTGRFIQQKGQSVVEFIIIFPALMILTLGVFQLALIYQAKVTLNYATFHAARSGAVNNADKTMIELAFYRGLAPLYTTVDNSDSDSDVEELQKGRDKIREIHEAGYICMERVSPSEEAFLDFSDDDGVIPNNNLIYRTAEIGANSNVSIQDANLLKLRITYCHELIVPFFPVMLSGFVDGTDADGITITTAGAYQDSCYAADRIPIVAQAIVRMQSDAENDEFPNKSIHSGLSSCD